MADNFSLRHRTIFSLLVTLILATALGACGSTDATTNRSNNSAGAAVVPSLTATSIQGLIAQVQQAFPNALPSSAASALASYGLTEAQAALAGNDLGLTTESVERLGPIVDGTWNFSYSDSGMCYVLNGETVNQTCSNFAAPSEPVAQLLFAGGNINSQAGITYQGTDLVNNSVSQGNYKVYTGFSLPTGQEAPYATNFAVVVVGDITLNGVYQYSAIQTFIGATTIGPTRSGSYSLQCGALNNGAVSAMLSVRYTEYILNGPLAGIGYDYDSYLAPSNPGSAPWADPSCSSLYGF